MAPLLIDINYLGIQVVAVMVVVVVVVVVIVVVVVVVALLLVIAMYQAPSSLPPYLPTLA